MKTMISRVFSRGERARGPTPHSALSSELTTSDIENYYLKVIVESLRRMLLPMDSFEVRIRRADNGPTGLSGFAAYVRILKWDSVVTPVLLQNLPVVDARVRKLINASVLLEATHFAGLWVQASSGTKGCPDALLGMPCELVHLRARESAVS